MSVHSMFDQTLGIRVGPVLGSNCPLIGILGAFPEYVFGGGGYDLSSCP